MSRPAPKSDSGLLAFAYARVSTAGQAEKDLSLPAQLDAIAKYAREHGLQIVQQFLEPGASGRDDNRPELRKMIEACLAPGSKIKAILVYQHSRFMRDATRARVLKRALRKAGVRVIAVSQETSDDPTGHLVEGFFELIDEWESQVNGMRTAAAMKQAASQGYFPGARPPFGYAKVKIEAKPGVHRARLEPNAAEAAVLREVFQLYVGGEGAKSVAKELNRRGLRLRNGKLWSKEAVLHIIDEPAPTGTFYWGRRRAKRRPDSDQESIAVVVEPILDQHIYDEAQRVRAARDPERNPGRTGSSPLLLANLIRCGHCDAPFILETSGKRAPDGSYGYRYYNCRSALKRGPISCKGNRLPAQALEQRVLDHLANHLFTKDQCQQILRDLIEETGLLRKRTSEHRRQLKVELDDVTRRLRRWQEAFETGDLNPRDGAERISELRQRQQELEATLAKVVPLRAPPPHLYSDEGIARFQASVRSTFMQGDALARTYLRFLVERITVHSDRVTIVGKADSAARMMAEASARTSPSAGANGEVLVSDVDWLREQDSNLRPIG